MKTGIYKHSFLISGLVSILLTGVYSCQKDRGNIAANPQLKVDLGKQIFHDKNLSNPIGQACASCHAVGTGFTDPNHNAVSSGADNNLFGNRNAPMAAYTMFVPAFHYDNIGSSYVGGLFLDGRVNTLEEQAMKPFLNKVEMANSDLSMVVGKLKRASYYSLFEQIYGKYTSDSMAMGQIVDAIAAFERSAEMNPFSSKFDLYLKGQVLLSDQEMRGMNIFKDTARAKCAKCHLIDPDPVSGKVLFTDFTYNNDGVPKNPNNPFYTIPAIYNPMGMSYIDKGLGDILHDSQHDGEFRVSSLRNIAITAPYFHNGVFSTLEEVVHFYNVRDVSGSGFAPAEVSANIDTKETGNQHLTAQEEQDIVAFMKTLTDGY